MGEIVTVNRTKELALFGELLDFARTRGSAVLALEEASGRGKSRLLQCFRQVCREREVGLSFVDLVGGSLTPIDILNRMTSDLGDFDFQRCRNVLTRRSIDVRVAIDRNITIGSTTLSVDPIVYIQGATPEEQKQFWSDAAHAFHEDICGFRERADDRVIVMFFDTYEKAAPDSQAWICDHLLPMVALNRMGGLLFVVAGKICPRPSGEWEDQYKPLALHLLKKEDWVEYAARVGALLNEEQIQLLYDKHEGATIKMAETIALFVR
jgi:hypothetical protein